MTRRPSPTDRVLIVSGSVGAGHDGAARELAERLRAGGVEVDVQDFLTAVPGWTRWVLDRLYLAASRWVPAMFDAAFEKAARPGLSWWSFRALAARGAAEVARWVAEGGYDLVVSTYPPSSQCLGQLRADGRCPVPVVTYVTDPAVHAAWVHPAVDHHLTVTRASAEQGSVEHGVAAVDGGPLVPARFRHASRWEVERLREELGGTAGYPLALLAAGSLGLGDVAPAAADVAAAGFVPVVLCGRNAELQEELADIPTAVALGWRTDVHLLMHAADVLVHNAGGLSFTEAMVAGLPAVTYRPIPGHGRANAAFLAQAGLAPWAHDREELAALLAQQAALGRQAPPPGDPAELIHVMLGVARTASA